MNPLREVGGPPTTQSVLERLEALQQELEWLIMATPTGKNRNHLTDANLLLLGAISHLKEVK